VQTSSGCFGGHRLGHSGMIGDPRHHGREVAPDASLGARSLRFDAGDEEARHLRRALAGMAG